MEDGAASKPKQYLVHLKCWRSFADGLPHHFTSLVVYKLQICKEQMPFQGPVSSVENRLRPTRKRHWQNVEGNTVGYWCIIGRRAEERTTTTKASIALFPILALGKQFFPEDFFYKEQYTSSKTSFNFSQLKLQKSFPPEIFKGWLTIFLVGQILWFPSSFLPFWFLPQHWTHLYCVGCTAISSMSRVWYLFLSHGRGLITAWFWDV